MIVESIMFAAFVTGFGTLFLWRKNSPQSLVNNHPLAHQKNRYQKDRILCHQTKKCLNYLQKQSRSLYENPELAVDIFKRLRYLLPVTGIFTEQRARLHYFAQSIRNELFLCLHNKPNSRRKACILSVSFKRLVNINIRLERIDWAAAEQEKRISCLIQLSQNYMAANHYIKLPDCIKVAKRIQHFNGKLLRNIHRTEKQLSFISETSKFNTADIQKNERMWERVLKNNS